MLDSDILGNVQKVVQPIMIEATEPAKSARGLHFRVDEVGVAQN